MCYSDDVFTSVRERKPVTHIRTQEWQTTATSNQFPRDKIKSTFPSYIFHNREKIYDCILLFMPTLNNSLNE